jgi:hypothetical protein
LHFRGGIGNVEKNSIKVRCACRDRRGGGVQYECSERREPVVHGSSCELMDGPNWQHVYLYDLSMGPDSDLQHKYKLERRVPADLQRMEFIFDDGRSDKNRNYIAVSQYWSARL